jgi:hypothetical protein
MAWKEASPAASLALRLPDIPTPALIICLKLKRGFYHLMFLYFTPRYEAIWNDLDYWQA